MRKYISIILCSALLVSVLTAGAEETPENISEEASVSAEIVEMIPSDSEEDAEYPEEEIENTGGDPDTPESNGTETVETAPEEDPATEPTPAEPVQTEQAEELTPPPDPAETAAPSELPAEDSISLMSADEWTAVSDMTEPRTDTELVTANGELYAVGGMGSSGYLCSIVKYNDAENTWSYVTDIPGGVKGAGVTAYESKIYLAGGYSSTGYHDSVQVYDVSTGEWSELSPMLKKRVEPAAMYADNKLYVFGGRNGTGIVYSYEYYDMTEGKWNLVTTGFSRTMIRVGAGAKYIDGYVCIYGGFDDYYYNAGVNMYPADNMKENIPITDSSYESISAACGAEKELFYAWDRETGECDTYEITVSDGEVSSAEVMNVPLPGANEHTSYSMYNGYVYAVGGYSAEGKQYLADTKRYSVYYGDYVTGDGQITSEATESGNSITLNVDTGKEYMLFISAGNISSFAGCEFKLEYVDDAFTVEDTCAMTVEKDTGTGAVPGTDIEITESTAGGLSFICTEDIPQGTTVTKAVNAVILKANSSGLRTITYGMIKGE